MYFFNPISFLHCLFMETFFKTLILPKENIDTNLVEWWVSSNILQVS